MEEEGRGRGEEEKGRSGIEGVRTENERREGREK